MTSYAGLGLLLGEMSFSPFELGMMLCFGICWPVSIVKLIRTKRTEGKSLLFVVIVWFGYLSGVIYKIWWKPDLVTVFYIANLIFVFIDIVLHIKYSRNSMETLKVPFTLR